MATIPDLWRDSASTTAPTPRELLFTLLVVSSLAPASEQHALLYEEWAV